MPMPTAIIKNINWPFHFGPSKPKTNLAHFQWNWTQKWAIYFMPMPMRLPFSTLLKVNFQSFSDSFIGNGLCRNVSKMWTNCLDRSPPMHLVPFSKFHWQNDEQKPSNDGRMPRWIPLDGKLPTDSDWSEQGRKWNVDNLGKSTGQNGPTKDHILWSSMPIGQTNSHNVRLWSIYDLILLYRIRCKMASTPPNECQTLSLKGQFGSVPDFAVNHDLSKDGKLDENGRHHQR